MNFALSHSLEVLERTPRVVDALLRGTSTTWQTADEGPETWSAIDVIGHLIHGEETDWVPRAPRHVPDMSCGLNFEMQNAEGEVRIENFERCASFSILNSPSAFCIRPGKSDPAKRGPDEADHGLSQGH